MNTKINVKTLYNKDMIKSRIEYPDNGVLPNTSNISEQIINLQEEGVRKALIALGWTPPPTSDNSDYAKLKELIDSQEDIPSEIQKVLNENFTDLF